MTVENQVFWFVSGSPWPRLRLRSRCWEEKHVTCCWAKKFKHIKRNCESEKSFSLTSGLLVFCAVVTREARMRGPLQLLMGLMVITACSQSLCVSTVQRTEVWNIVILIHESENSLFSLSQVNIVVCMSSLLFTCWNPNLLSTLILVLTYSHVSTWWI